MTKQKTFRFADGTAEQPETTGVTPTNEAAEEALQLGQLLGRQALCRRPGLHIGSWFITGELIVLTALLVTGIVIACRLKD